MFHFSIFSTIHDYKSSDVNFHKILICLQDVNTTVMNKINEFASTPVSVNGFLNRLRQRKLCQSSVSSSPGVASKVQVISSMVSQETSMSTIVKRTSEKSSSEVETIRSARYTTQQQTTIELVAISSNTQESIKTATSAESDRMLRKSTSRTVLPTKCVVEAATGVPNKNEGRLTGDKTSDMTALKGSVKMSAATSRFDVEKEILEEIEDRQRKRREKQKAKTACYYETKQRHSSYASRLQERCQGEQCKQGNLNRLQSKTVTRQISSRAATRKADDSSDASKDETVSDSDADKTTIDSEKRGGRNCRYGLRNLSKVHETTTEKGRSPKSQCRGSRPGLRAHKTKCQFGGKIIECETSKMMKQSTDRSGRVRKKQTKCRNGHSKKPAEDVKKLRVDRADDSDGEMMAIKVRNKSGCIKKCIVLLDRTFIVPDKVVESTKMKTVSNKIGPNIAVMAVKCADDRRQMRLKLCEQKNGKVSADGKSVKAGVHCFKDIAKENVGCNATWTRDEISKFDRYFVHVHDRPRNM